MLILYANLLTSIEKEKQKTEFKSSAKAQKNRNEDETGENHDTPIER